MRMCCRSLWPATLPRAASRWFRWRMRRHGLRRSAARSISVSAIGQDDALRRAAILTIALAWMARECARHERITAQAGSAEDTDAIACSPGATPEAAQSHYRCVREILGVKHVPTVSGNRATRA